MKMLIAVSFDPNLGCNVLYQNSEYLLIVEENKKKE